MTADPLTVLPRSRFLGEPGDGPMEADVLGHQLEFQHVINENWSALIGVNIRDTSLEGFSTENGFFGGRQFLQRDGENLTRFRRFRDYDASYQVFRAEISGAFSTGNIQHRLIIGLDADKFENDQVFLRARGSAIDDTQPIEAELERLRVTNQVINIFNPIYGAYPLPVPSANTDRIEIQKTNGLFIQDQISLTDKFDLRLGVRFDDYRQTLNNRRADNISNFSTTPISPQLGAVYKISDNISWYAVYGENFRPLSGADDENNLEPNESKSTETGIKFNLNDGAIEGTVAIFSVEQSNISTVDADFNPTAVGEAESQGVEFDLNGYLTENLKLWLSYSFVDAQTKNAFNDPNFGTEIPAGANLLNIPQSQLSAQLTQRTQLAGNELTLTAGLVYVGDRNGFFSDQDFNLPSYTTVRAAVNYKVSESLALSAYVDNLFDETYFTNSFADVWVLPGAPRNARVSATFRF